MIYIKFKKNDWNLINYSQQQQSNMATRWPFCESDIAGNQQASYPYT